ncbi:hypothetical protein Tco_0817630 [Tanacetum coccineum]
MFQDQYYSFSLEEFAEILGVPCEGACVFTDKWALYELANGLPGDGPYQTFLPSLDDIITLVRVDREGPVTRVRHKKEINVIEYQVCAFLRSSPKHNLTSSCNGSPSCALVKKYTISDFAEALTPL